MTLDLPCDYFTINRVGDLSNVAESLTIAPDDFIISTTTIQPRKVDQNLSLHNTI